MTFVDAKMIPDNLESDDQYNSWADHYFKMREKYETATRADLATLLHAQQHPAVWEPPPEPQQRLFTSFSEMKASGLRINWLIHGIKESGCVGMTFGPSYSGKSLIELDQSLCIATGSDWNGRKVKQGLVVYFIGEGYGGFFRRIEAWRIRHGKTDEEIDHFFIPSRTQISFETKLGAAYREIKSIEESRHLPVVSIVIDTLARHIPSGSDENSGKDMGIFTDMVSELGALFPGSTVTIVHHSGYGETGRGRGSSSLPAAMDFIFSCKDGTLTCTKMKDGPEPENIEFKIDTVDLGEVDEDGKPITSAVPVYGERSVKRSGLTAHEQMGIDSLLKAAAGKSGTASKENQWGALVGDWRSVFYELRLESEPDLGRNTLKSSFERMAEKLLKKGIVRHDGHNRIPTSNEHQQEILTMQCTSGLTA